MAATIIPIVKENAEIVTVEPQRVPCIQTFFYFPCKCIYIPVNNLVLISALSSEKESLFGITRQLTLRVNLTNAEFCHL